MENFTHILSTIFIYNFILMIGVLSGAKLMEARIFEEMKEFYFIDFVDVEIPNSAPSIMMALALPLSILLIPMCGLISFAAIVWMSKMRGEGYEKFQDVLVSMGLLRQRVLVRSNQIDT